MTEKWYLKSQEEIESVLNTSAADGLDPSAAASRLRTDGGNNIFSLKRRTSLRVALRECFDIPAILLLVVLAISGMDHRNILCMLVVLTAVILRVLFYIRSMHVFAGIAIRAIPKARVMRGRRLVRIDSRRIVPGDLIYLLPGDFVPADARIVKGKVRVSEHRVTKRKAPSEKENTILSDRPDMELSAITNMVFAGSRVVDGRAMAIVTDTGEDTLLLEFNGRISISTYERMPVVRRMMKNVSACEIILLALVVVSAFIGMAVGVTSIIRSFVFSLAAVVTAVSECYFVYASYVISQAVQTLDGAKNGSFVQIKDLRILDLLTDMDFLIIRDTFTPDDGAKLASTVSKLKRLGVQPILLTDRVDYSELFFGKLTCFAEKKESFLNRAKFLAATDARLWQLTNKITAFSCLDTEESLRLLRVLQMNGASVAVLSQDKQDADLLREADVSFTFASPSDNDREVSETEMISDICISAKKHARSGLRAVAACICLSRTVPAKMNALFWYFVTSATARVLLCLCGIFAPDIGFDPYPVLVGGLLGDLAFALTLAASGGGKHVIPSSEPFRFSVFSSVRRPVANGLVSAACILLACVAGNYFFRGEGMGLILVCIATSSVLNGILSLHHERIAVTPLGWMPTVIFVLGLLAVFALLILVPPLANLFLVGDLSLYTVLIGLAGGLLQVFCQKFLFGK